MYILIFHKLIYVNKVLINTKFKNVFLLHAALLNSVSSKNKIEIKLVVYRNFSNKLKRMHIAVYYSLLV